MQSVSPRSSRRAPDVGRRPRGDHDRARAQRYGDVVGLIRTRERYGAALPKGSALVGPVNAALTAMRQDGTISRLAKPWLELNLSGVRTFPTGS